MEEDGKKLIFLDIDGTLTEPGSNRPPESALEAVKRAREKGHKVFLCSGRNYGMLSPVLAFGFDGAVASSGGHIRCGGQVIYDCPMTERQRRQALDLLKENGIFRTVEWLDCSYTDEGFKEFLRQNAGQGGNSELLRWREQIESSLGIRPMREYQGQPVYKIVMMGRDLGQFAEPKRVLGEEFAFCIQEADSFGIINGELVNRQFDKGKGVEAVCRHLGVSVKDTIAFGDSMNDLEMLEAAAFGVCMENGSQALKETADWVCPGVSEDGLYLGFQKLGVL